MPDLSTSVDENPWSRRPVVASVIITSVIVVLGLVVALSNIFGDDTDGSAAAPPKATATASTGTPSPSRAAMEPSVCGLEGADDAGKIATAPVASWSLVGTTAAPTVKGSGPGKTDPDGYRSCFARTTIGALAAAANYVAIGSEDSLREKFYKDATVPGPGQDALLARPVTGSGAGGTRIQIEGFRLLRYTGEQADVDVAVRTSNGALAATVLNLQWSGGDWKLRLANDGTELSPSTQIPDLAGFIPWSGA